MYVYLQRYLQNTVTCVHGFFSKVFVSCRSAWLLAIIYSVDLFTCCTCVLWWLYLFISIYRLIDLLLMQLFLIYPQACSCNELFFVYISLSKMICAWAFYSIYLAALLVHMVTILNIIGVACHHLCSINSLTNLTRPVLIKFHPLILPYKAKSPSKKPNKSWVNGKTWGFQRWFLGGSRPPTTRASEISRSSETLRILLINSIGLWVKHTRHF